jgi:hypothetical protein
MLTMSMLVLFEPENGGDSFKTSVEFQWTTWRYIQLTITL